mgnify:CR=1 FL=1
MIEWSPDKKDTLLYYLPYEVKKRVIHLDFEEKGKTKSKRDTKCQLVFEGKV